MRNDQASSTRSMINHQNQPPNERLYGFIFRSRLGSLPEEVFALASIVAVSGQNTMACGVKEATWEGWPFFLV